MRILNKDFQDPAVVRELAAVDAALAGDPVDPELLDLAALACSLQAERPVPRPEFVRALDAAERTGFSRAEIDRRDGSQPAIRRRRSSAHDRRRALPLAVGTAALLFLVTTTVIFSGLLSEDHRKVETAQAPAVKPPGAPATRAAPGKTSDATPVVPLSGGTSAGSRAAAGVAPHARSRKVERAASLVLAPQSSEVEDVADDVIRVTDRYDGFVLRSSVAGGDSGNAGGTLDLRIPSNRLQAAIRDLSSLTHVRSRSQSTQDVTGRFISRRSRLNDALAERRALLRQLGHADTPNETASIRARLRLITRDIELARARLHALQNRISYAAVTVELAPDDSGGHEGGSTLRNAIGDAGHILGTSLAVGIVSLAIAIPLCLGVLAAWAGIRRFARRRREQALDDTI